MQGNFAMITLAKVKRANRKTKRKTNQVTTAIHEHCINAAPLLDRLHQLPRLKNFVCGDDINNVIRYRERVL